MAMTKKPLNIRCVYDDEGEISWEPGLNPTRMQISVFFESNEHHRTNIVVVDGKVHVEQFKESGDEHLHTTIVDLVQ